MLLDLGGDIVHLGIGLGDIGLALRQVDAIVTVVDPCQDLALASTVSIVTDLDRGDISGDFWRDDRIVGLEIGIVGGFEVTPDEEPAPAIGRAGHQDQQRRAQQQSAGAAVRAGLGAFAGASMSSTG